jgi:hypothetical protein
MTEKAPVLLS